MSGQRTANDGLAAAQKYGECHEDVSRQGQSQPCDKPAVALLRLDPEEHTPYLGWAM